MEVVVEEGMELGGVLVFHSARAGRLGRVSPKEARDPVEGPSFDAILGNSPVMREARDRARRMAESGAPVLLEGETGVGKELFARAIHGVRASAGPFVPVNCGGMPRDLVASEIFGYSKGAFTGADAAGRPGKLEAADGGLLCLDEIGGDAAGAAGLPASGAGRRRGISRRQSRGPQGGRAAGFHDQSRAFGGGGCRPVP